MIKGKLIGLQQLSFTDREGNDIRGVNLYLAFPDPQISDGMRADKFFIRDTSIISPEVKAGDTVGIEFNYKGKIQSLQKLVK